MHETSISARAVAQKKRSWWPALAGLLLLSCTLGGQAVWAQGTPVLEQGRALAAQDQANQDQADQAEADPASASGDGTADADAAPLADTPETAETAEAAASAPAEDTDMSNAEALAFVVVLTLFPLSVLAIRWNTQRQIERLMNVDSDEQPITQAFRRHTVDAELRAALQPQFRLHDAQHANADALQAREAFVTRSLGLFRHAVLLDVVAGVVYVLILALLGMTTRDTAGRSDMTLGFIILGLLYPALAGLRYWVYRRQFRPKDGRFRRSWLGRIPLLAWLRELISPRLQAAMAGAWAFVMFVTGLGLAFEDTETAAHRATGALLAVLAVLHVVLAWRVIRRLQREPGVRLLVLRVFGIDANASFTFGRVLAFWQHFGNHFTVLDPSIWRHRFPLMSWRTGGFIAAVGLVGFVALGTVLQNPAWEPYGFAITAVVLVPLLAVYAFFTQPLLRREFIRSRVQLVAVQDKLEQRPRTLDLSFRHLEAMCHNNTWELAVEEFARRSQALLMDLRGFCNERRGCQSEVDFLLDTVPLRQVLFLVEAGGDHALAKKMILDRWEFLGPNGPNLDDRAPLVNIYVSKASDEADVQGILDLLIQAAQAGSEARSINDAAWLRRNPPMPLARAA